MTAVRRGGTRRRARRVRWGQAAKAGVDVAGMGGTVVTIGFYRYTWVSSLQSGRGDRQGRATAGEIAAP